MLWGQCIVHIKNCVQSYFDSPRKLFKKQSSLSWPLYSSLIGCSGGNGDGGGSPGNGANQGGAEQHAGQTAPSLVSTR